MGRKISIYAGAPIEAALADLAGEYGENRSGRLNTVAQRYREMLLAIIWANVADSRGLGKKWGIDQDALVRKVRAVPRSTLIAIVEACARFWSRAEREIILPAEGETKP